MISFDGIDLSEYELDVQYLDIKQVTINELLCLATDECDIELAKKVIEKGADVNYKCEGVDAVVTNIAYCKENGVELAELLLNKGADINGADEDNDSFLSYAISSDNLELVKYLIEKGADHVQRDTNRNMGCLPIHGVTSLKMLNFLISKGFEISPLCDNGRNLLHFAAMQGLKDVAQYLIDKKLVDVNQKDKNGETPLDYAVKNYQPAIVEIIKKKK